MHTRRPLSLLVRIGYLYEADKDEEGHSCEDSVCFRFVRKPPPALLLCGAIYLHHIGQYAAEVARTPYMVEKPFRFIVSSACDSSNQ